MIRYFFLNRDQYDPMTERSVWASLTQFQVHSDSKSANEICGLRIKGAFKSPLEFAVSGFLDFLHITLIFVLFEEFGLYRFFL